MNKCAFLFTGQGSQYIGMGKDLYEQKHIFRKIINETNEYLKIDLLKICSNQIELSKTHNAQIAIFAISYGIYKLLKQNDIIPDCIAGFSLGEITSLAVSEILSFNDTLDLIKIRGEVMQEGCEYKSGSMYSIIGADDKLVEEVCETISKSNQNKYIIPANYNCPGQIVISGETEAVEEAVKIFTEKKIRAVKLNVAGAFHSELMQYKQEKLIEFLKTLNFNQPQINLYSNVTGKKFIFDENIKNFMINYIPKQMSNPVRFRTELENIEKNGCDLFIEIGAGKALSGFVRRTCENAKFTNIQDVDTFEWAVKIFNEK